MVESDSILMECATFILRDEMLQVDKYSVDCTMPKQYTCNTKGEMCLVFVTMVKLNGFEGPVFLLLILLLLFIRTNVQFYYHISYLNY